MTNQQIIQSLRSGDHQQVIKKLYESYPMIASFIKSNGGSDQEAKDVFQEALLVLFKKSQDPKFQLTAAPGTYLYSVCRFMWKDELKKKNRKSELNSDDTLSGIPETIKDHQEEERKYSIMDAILQKLGEPCKQLLEAFYYKKFSMEMLADMFGYKNITTAKTQKYKCLERAKKMAASAIAVDTNTSGS